MAVPKSNRKRIAVGSSELRQRISHYLNRAAFSGETVLIERNGIPKPIAVLVSYEEFERLTNRRTKVAAPSVAA